MKTFLEDLRKELKKQKLNDVEIADIINDHEEMISQAMEEGLAEDQIVEKFGNPKKLAEELANTGTEGESEEANQIEDSTLIQSFSKDDIQAVEFKLFHEDINILQSSSDQFELFGENVNLEYYNFYEKAGTIHIERKHTMDLKFRIMRDRGETFTLKIPKDFQLNLLGIKTKSSDIEIEQLNTNHLQIETISGDLTLSNSSIKDSKIKAISGDAHIKSSHIESISISNVSGDYKFEDTKIKESLTISSVSGDFFAENSEAKDVVYRAVSGDFDGREFYPENLTLKSISGDITIKNKDKSKAINIKSKKTLSGDINI